MGDLESNLAAVLAESVAGFDELQNCTQLTAGASQETWCIELTANGEPLRLALRRNQPTVETESGTVGINLHDEARLFQIAAEAGIPVPRVIHVLRPSDQLGEGFLMEWLNGETLGQRIVKSEELAEIRPQLAYLCGEALGNVHAIDWKAAGLADTLPIVDSATLVDETWAIYRDLGVPYPMIDFTWRWLKENLPETSRQCLVHGDFRNGNLMINAEGIEAVLDWEIAHIGDPVRDLGWLCVNSWRFGVRDMAVGGFGKLDDLLKGYKASTGIDVNPADVRFWEVFGSFWWACTTLMMANAWRTGETPSLERPVIGRRSSEAQMDCVNLLIPGEFTLPNPDSPLADGSQLPMPAELIEGVRGFLKDKAAGQLDPHNAFLARVGANSLGIAQRELLHGPTLALAEFSRLRDLPVDGETLDELRRSLVNQLRNGLALDTDTLATHLRETVAGQLFIDQPRYSALRPL